MICQLFRTYPNGAPAHTLDPSSYANDCVMHCVVGCMCVYPKYRHLFSNFFRFSHFSFFITFFESFFYFTFTMLQIRGQIVLLELYGMKKGAFFLLILLLLFLFYLPWNLFSPTSSISPSVFTFPLSPMYAKNNQTSQ